MILGDHSYYVTDNLLSVFQSDVIGFSIFFYFLQKFCRLFIYLLSYCFGFHDSHKLTDIVTILNLNCIYIHLPTQRRHVKIIGCNKVLTNFKTVLSKIPLSS